MTRPQYALSIALGIVVVVVATTSARLAAGQGMQEIRNERLITGLNQPLYVTAPPSDPSRLFVVERAGKVKIYDFASESLVATPYLDVTDRVHAGQDGGLVGMAFDPNFSTNGYVYFNYTDDNGDNHLSRFSSLSANQLDPGSEQPILFLEQPHTAHNGDWIGFGPDEMLYFTTGDGGDQHNPTNSGQDLSSLLAKVLRIDVTSGLDDFPDDPAANYHVPADNPLVGSGGRDEVFAYGLRNPWKASFDRANGDLYIGDVGQGTFEEIDYISADSNGGENFGWRLREGFGPTPTGGIGGPLPGAVDPVYAYPHGGAPFQGNSVTGGYVYRGPIESLQGKYFFSDFTNSRIYSLEVDRSTGLMVDGSLTDWTDQLTPDAGSLNSVVSFGEDAVGNLYIASIGGDVFKIDADPIQPPTGFTLRINRDDGSAVLESTLGESIPFDGYAIRSTVGSLNPDGFLSLADQGGDGGTWQEIAPLDRNQLGELNPSVEAALEPTQSRQLGNLFLPQDAPFGVDFEDLTISFTNEAGETLLGDVVYEGDKRYNNMVVVVDPLTGQAVLQNQSTIDVTFDAYTVASEDGSLLLDDWISLEDQGGANGQWREIAASANQLGELQRVGATTLGPLESFDLGAIYNSAGNQDLVFEFLMTSDDVATLGVVSYQSAAVAGDFDGNGIVNGADLTDAALGWEARFGVDLAGSDFLAWQSNYDAAAAATATPEPAAAALAILGLAGGVGGRRRRRQR